MAPDAPAGRKGGMTGVPAVASTVPPNADVTSEHRDAEGLCGGGGGFGFGDLRTGEWPGHLGPPRAMV